MLGKIKKLPKEVILLMVVVIVVLICFFINKGTNNETGSVDNNNSQNSESESLPTYSEEKVGENEIKYTSSTGFSWTEETNEDGEIIKSTYDDGTYYYEWAYYEDKFNEAEEKAKDDVFYYLSLSDEKLVDLAREIRDIYEDTKDKNKDDISEQSLELYEKAIGLTLAVHDTDKEIYNVGRWARDFVLYRYDGYKGLKEFDEIEANLNSALTNVLGE